MIRLRLMLMLMLRLRLRLRLTLPLTLTLQHLRDALEGVVREDLVRVLGVTVRVYGLEVGVGVGLRA